MIKDKYLDINKITTDKSVLRIFDIVRSHGGIVRFVGGAVRDAIAGKHGGDLNLSTDLSPDELVEACEDAGVKTTPIGLKHGSLGIVINGTTLEVTSLRKNIKTDKNHSMLEFTDDWRADASRRDLTINAVYADDEGNVFDYYNGINDLEKGIVRFIGDADQCIKENYLHILRFFRFYSLFAKTPIDKKSLQACINNRNGLKSVAVEQIRDELTKIILTPRAAEVLEIMLDNGILLNWLGKSDHLSNLEFLIRLEKACGVEPNAMRRFFVLYFPDKALAENFAMRMHLSKKQRETMMKWASTNIGIENILEDKLRRKVLYLYGREFCLDKFLIEASKQQIVPDNLLGLIKQISESEIPVFPLTGRDVIMSGKADDKEVGNIIERLKNRWITQDFSLSKEELLSAI